MLLGLPKEMPGEALYRGNLKSRRGVAGWGSRAMPGESSSRAAADEQSLHQCRLSDSRDLVPVRNIGPSEKGMSYQR